MPAKHVHFTDGAFSPLMSGTPSCTYSLSTVPSSAGPFTPPPSIKSQRSPYDSTPLPHIGEIGLAHILAGSSTSSPLLYDLLVDPAFVLDGIHKHILDQTALTVPLPAITITNKDLPWAMTITRSTHQFVTVRDVLQGVYIALRKPVSQKEYQQAPPYLQKAASDSFSRRCSRLKADRRAYETEYSKGLKRVDFLLSRTQWRGLSPSLKGPDVWELQTS